MFRRLSEKNIIFYNMLIKNFDPNIAKQMCLSQIQNDSKVPRFYFLKKKKMFHAFKTKWWTFCCKLRGDCQWAVIYKVSWA